MMYVFYFLGSIILANVFLEKDKMHFKKWIIGSIIWSVGFGIYVICPVRNQLLYFMIFSCMILIHMCFKGSFKHKLWSFFVTQCVYFIIFTFGWVLLDAISYKLNVVIWGSGSILGIWALAVSGIGVKIFKGTFLYYREKSMYEALSWMQALFYVVLSVAIIYTANIGIIIYKEGIAFKGGDMKIALISYTALVGIILCYFRSHRKATLECEEQEAKLISSFSAKQLEAYKRLERLEREGQEIEVKLGQWLVQMKDTLAEEELAHIKLYVDEIQRQLTKESHYILTGNDIVDAIINEKYKLACEKHVFISVNISLPDKLLVDIGDLCLIIGNSIDYALEACEKVTLGKGHKVKIKGVWYKGYILFRIWFSKAKHVEGEMELNSIEETQLALENDVYGLGAVAKCLEQYDGRLALYTEGKWHKLELYFNTMA